MQEFHSGKINLDESPTVVQAMLEFIYGLDINLCENLLPTFRTGQDSKKMAVMISLMDTYIAADKYGITGLQDNMITAINARLPFITKAESLVAIAEYAYKNAPDHNGQACAMLDKIIDFLKTHLKAILLDTNASSAIHNNRTLMFDLLGHVAESSATPEKLSLSVKRKREEIVYEATHGRRKSLRTRHHIPGTYNFRVDVSKAP